MVGSFQSEGCIGDHVLQAMSAPASSSTPLGPGGWASSCCSSSFGYPLNKLLAYDDWSYMDKRTYDYLLKRWVGGGGSTLWQIFCHTIYVRHDFIIVLENMQGRDKYHGFMGS